ncbi:hypothetical protein R3W88_029435 [Solanum pinnatisectum]|uniref:RNase H type-1 domain-containing protein n=1 Tax=Solanum pinnatisectum TaxID=50273 RepID=A0AAV9K719_9SOLN|nr:hypothetical protein R3W88_029435 [Solanum pinnatisectum]
MVVKWILMSNGFPPSSNGLKFNLDGSFNKNSLLNGIGGVFRNHEGTWITGFYRKIRGINHTHMELQALHEGVSYNLCISEIETDASEVINFLEQPPPLYANIVNACRSAMRKSPDPA